MEEQLGARDPGRCSRTTCSRASTARSRTTLARNYAPDVVVLTGEGVHHGHDGVRKLAERLRRELPNASFTCTARVVAGEVALLEWTASTPSCRHQAAQ